MALWGFNRESTQVNSGANTVAGIKAGYQPPFVAGGRAGEMAEKRNIIATKNGWVRREVRVMTGVENATRIIDQEIVEFADKLPDGPNFELHRPWMFLFDDSQKSIFWLLKKVFYTFCCIYCFVI